MKGIPDDRQRTVREPPPFDLPAPAAGVAVHWFEQNSFAVRNPEGTLFLVDPYFPRRRPPERFIRPLPPVDESCIPTDFVLLTHAHGDHTCPESLRRVHRARPNARYAGPPESIEKIRGQTDIPAGRLEILREGESIEVEGIAIHAVLSKPHGGDPEAGIEPPDSTHLGYIVETAGLSLYFSGDPIRTFAEYDALVDPVAAKRPDIGFLVTHPTEGEFPLFEDSRKMARRIGLRTAVPSHYACFVKRTYDPAEWAEHFGPDDPRPLIIPPNGSVNYPLESP